MRFDQDPSRAALLRDLLLDYPTRMADNPPPLPAGIDPESPEAEAFYEQWMMSPQANEFTPEGNYPVPDGRPDARLVADAPYDVDLRALLMERLRGDQ